MLLRGKGRKAEKKGTKRNKLDKSEGRETACD